MFSDESSEMAELVHVLVNGHLEAEQASELIQVVFVEYLLITQPQDLFT